VQSHYPLITADIVPTRMQSRRRLAWRMRTRRVLAYLLALLLLTASALSLLIYTEEMRQVMMPLLALLDILALFYLVMWTRTPAAPLELGTLYAAAIFLYAAIPILNYLAGGLHWTIVSDGRLFHSKMTPVELGGFSWLNVVYLGAFAGAYLLFRGWVGSVPSGKIIPPARKSVIVLLTLAIVLVAFFAVLQALTGVKMSASYAEAGTVAQQIQRLPYVVEQIATHLFEVLFTLKIALAVLLVTRFEQKWARWLLGGWLLLEVVLSVTRMGSRSEMVLLLLSVTLAYHWWVKPLKTAVLLPVGTLLLAAFLVLGIVRSINQQGVKVPPAEMLAVACAHPAVVAGMTNEFQTLFATAYDLQQRKQRGVLTVPWQLYISDLYMVIPKQLLPFTKIDPSQWYLEVIGQQDAGVGYMFGVLSQAVIGAGWLELLLRGALLGFLFAKLHRWFIHHGSAFSTTIIYTWLCVWCHYTYRSTTFYKVSDLLLHVLPVLWIMRVVAQESATSSSEVTPPGSAGVSPA